MLVVNMVLRTPRVSDGAETKKQLGPYVDGHLVYMDTLLDAELRDNDIEGSFQHPDDFGLTNDGSITRS